MPSQLPDRPVRTIVVLTAAYLGISLIGSWTFVRWGFVRFDPAIGVIVPFSIVFGWAGIVAVVAGPLVHDVGNAAFGPGTAINCFGHLLAGLLVHRTHNTLRLGFGGSLPQWFTDYLVATLIAASTAAATIGWAGQVFGMIPFYLAAVYFVQYALAAVIVGLPVVALVTWIRFENDLIGTSDQLRTASSVPTLLVTNGWLWLGVIGSIGYYNIARIPPWVLHDAGLGLANSLVESGVFGQGAVHAQTILAGVAIGSLALLYRDDVSGSVAES